MFNNLGKFLGSADDREKQFELYNKHTGQVDGVYDTRADAYLFKTGPEQRIRVVRKAK